MRRLLFDPTLSNLSRSHLGSTRRRAVVMPRPLPPSELEAKNALHCGLADILCTAASAPSAAASSPSPPASPAESRVVLAIPTATATRRCTVAACQELLAARRYRARLSVETPHSTRCAAAPMVLPPARGALAAAISAAHTNCLALLGGAPRCFATAARRTVRPLLAGGAQLAPWRRVSNVFDGSKDLGGDFVLRSPLGRRWTVARGPARLQVGSFFVPRPADLVVASESHYSCSSR